ncbi:unnamed protein product [Trichogramma brassicae]|uniref:Uncharacterized protein n=1 Tax=Trichogramma brassicae TaxID=86971 RepID=A0A6H5HXV0_9HYME|nr:unnamed protein product [Trichogramma brassicae]
MTLRVRHRCRSNEKFLVKSTRAAVAASIGAQILRARARATERCDTSRSMASPVEHDCTERPRVNELIKLAIPPRIICTCTRRTRRSTRREAIKANECEESTSCDTSRARAREHEQVQKFDEPAAKLYLHRNDLRQRRVKIHALIPYRGCDSAKCHTFCEQSRLRRCCMDRVQRYDAQTTTCRVYEARVRSARVRSECEADIESRIHIAHSIINYAFSTRCWRNLFLLRELPLFRSQASHSRLEACSRLQQKNKKTCPSLFVTCIFDELAHSTTEIKVFRYVPVAKRESERETEREKSALRTIAAPGVSISPTSTTTTTTTALYVHVRPDRAYILPTTYTTAFRCESSFARGAP